MFFSYLDPGTGSVIIQAIIGLAVGTGVIVKAYWSKIRNWFGKSTKTSQDLRDNNSKSDGK